MWVKHYNKDTKTLTIPHTFNEELKDIPEETEIIIFNQNCDNCEYSKFNQQVDKLPKKLTHLTFGSRFNQYVDNLPENLTHLILGFEFNQPVDNLPKNLTHLTFGESFYQSVDNLPKNLKEIIFYSKNNINIKNIPFGAVIKYIN
jgi:hypothetical protein